jgi:group I intron endonuclease
MNSGIYCIENLINGKKIIGKTKNFKKRKAKHFSNLNKNIHYNTYLQNAFNKYGNNNFKFWIVEEYHPDKKLLDLMEIYFIAYYNSFIKDGGGYNLTRGGDGGLGYIHTDEWREKASKRVSGIKNPMYGKNGILNPMYGKNHTNNTRDRISKNRKGKNKGIDNPMFGKPGTRGMLGKSHSLESKIKMSNTKKEKGTSAGINNSMYGTHRTGEKNPNAKLKEIEVLEILDFFYNKNLSREEIKEKYNVSYGLVVKIINGKLWNSVYNNFIKNYKEEKGEEE